MSKLENRVARDLLVLEEKLLGLVVERPWRVRTDHGLDLPSPAARVWHHRRQRALGGRCAAGPATATSTSAALCTTTRPRILCHGCRDREGTNHTHGDDESSAPSRHTSSRNGVRDRSERVAIVARPALSGTEHPWADPATQLLRSVRL